MKCVRVFAVFGVIVLVVAIAVSRGQGDAEPGYTAAQIQEGMLQHPGQWFGHTVQLRGAVIARATLILPEQGNGPAIRYAIGGSEVQPHPAWNMRALPRDLWAPAAADPRAPLVVDQGEGGDGRRASWLRAIPLINRLLPPLRPDGHSMASYRVALSNASTARGCTARVCYWAILLDPPPSL